jgi:hypothetical protein
MNVEAQEKVFNRLNMEIRDTERKISKLKRDLAFAETQHALIRKVMEITGLQQKKEDLIKALGILVDNQRGTRI